jgi:hypothetical protein
VMSPRNVYMIRDRLHIPSDNTPRPLPIYDITSNATIKDTSF